MPIINPTNVLSIFIIGFYILPRLFINSKPQAFLTIDTRTSVERKYAAQSANLGLTVFSIITILSFSFPDITIFYLFLLFIFFSARFISPQSFIQINRMVFVVGVLLGINAYISAGLIEPELNYSDISYSVLVAVLLGMVNAVIIKMWLNRETTQQVSFLGLFSFNVDRSKTKENQLFYTIITMVMYYIILLLVIGSVLSILIFNTAEIGKRLLTLFLFVLTIFLNFIIPWSVTHIEVYGAEAFRIPSFGNKFARSRSVKQEKVYPNNELSKTKAFQPVQTIQPEGIESKENYSRVCVVCRLPIRDYDPLARCPDCFGETHKNCLENYVSDKKECPICYSKLSSEEIQLI